MGAANAGPFLTPEDRCPDPLRRRLLSRNAGRILTVCARRDVGNNLGTRSHQLCLFPVGVSDTPCSLDMGQDSDISGMAADSDSAGTQDTPERQDTWDRAVRAVSPDNQGRPDRLVLPEPPGTRDMAGFPGTGEYRDRMGTPDIRDMVGLEGSEDRVAAAGRPHIDRASALNGLQLQRC